MRVEARPQIGEDSVDLIDTIAEAPFYIASTGPSARPDDTFAVFDSHGDVGASAGGPDGLFDHDTRHLSLLELLINGMQPLLLASSVRDDNLTPTAGSHQSGHFLRSYCPAARRTSHRAHRISVE